MLLEEGLLQKASPQEHALKRSVSRLPHKHKNAIV
jgi:hypothetical protein